MEIKLLGVGSIEINIGNNVHIYIDSFNTINKPPIVTSKDLIVFTHSDGDHFSVEALLQNYEGNLIIGPPSITLPLLKTGKIDINKLVIEYPEQMNIPKSVNIEDVKIWVYQSKHFIGWNPIHCSYLIEYNHKKVYITGDSYIDENTELPGDIDCLICNLVDKGFITKNDDPRYAVHHHLSYLLNIITTKNPKTIIANHLIGFDGTIDPQELRNIITEYGFNTIIVPENSKEIIHI